MTFFSIFKRKETIKMKNNTIKTDYTAKKFFELSEEETNELIHICVFSAKEKMLRYYSNVPMIDKLLIEEKEDLISQTYIYSIKRAERLTDYDAFHIVYTCAIMAYFKILDERLGKRRSKGSARKNEIKCIGRYEEVATCDDELYTMKTQTDREYKSTDYIELKIDIENALTEEEISIVEYRKEGYTMEEIAIIKNTNKMNISRKIARIRKELKDIR